MAYDMIGGGRPMRTCVGCMQTDDHPKDQFVRDDGTSVFWHHDCHAIADPPCESCAWLVAHKGDGMVGSEWLQQTQVVHDAMSAEQLELHPAERDVVAGFEGGAH